jgi:hypothetical protein
MRDASNEIICAVRRSIYLQSGFSSESPDSRCGDRDLKYPNSLTTSKVLSPKATLCLTSRMVLSFPAASLCSTKNVPGRLQSSLYFCFYTGNNTSLVQPSGSVSLVQASWITSSNAYCSASIESAPAALLFFRYFSALSISSQLG